MAPWSPLDLGSTKLRLWTRPESQKYTTSARAAPENGTGVVGSISDESGNNNHIDQPTAGLRPSRRANGSVAFSGSTYLLAPALGAWAGDFAVVLVANATVAPSGNNPRIVSVEDLAGFAVIQSPSNVLLVRPPGAGVSSTWTVNAIHTLLASRSGTTMSASIDGGAATTAGSAGGALTNNTFGVGYSPGFAGNAFVGHIHELIVVASPTAGDLLNLASYVAARVTAGVYT